MSLVDELSTIVGSDSIKDAYFGGAMMEFNSHVESSFMKNRAGSTARNRFILADTLATHIAGRNAIFSICGRVLIPIGDTTMYWNEKSR